MSMRFALFKVMLLSLVRDRGALAMAFILPGLVFVIFAVIFSGAAGGDLTVRLAVADERKDELSIRFLAALKGTEGLAFIEDEAMTADGVKSFVRSGSADAGLIIRANGTAFDDVGEDRPAPLLVVTDPSREISVSVLQGALQELYFQTFPGAALRSTARVLTEKFIQLQPGQQVALERGLDAMRQSSEDDDAVELKFDAFYERDDILGNSEVPISIAYYGRGGGPCCFLLFSAANGAMTLLEEKESGLFARLASGPGGAGVILDGKFAFLVLQGFVQVLVIFLVAWLGFGVDLPGRFGLWAVTSLAAAVATAGIALCFVSLCRTRHQAQVLGNILILVISALGGSMVPRFLMPPFVQDLGWITPNTWALEAYASTFWRGEGIADVAVPLLALLAAGLAGLAVARLVVQRVAG